MEGCAACSGQVIEHVPLLQAECRDDGQDAFDESASVGAVSPKAAFSPQYSLTGVVRRLDTLLVDEGPERWFQLQYLAAPARDRAHRA